MWGFFNDWRRKMGCVTLLMALLAMIGWLRSRSVGELLSVPGLSGTTVCFVSVESSILWVRCEPGFSDELFFLKWEQHEFDPCSDYYHIFSVDNVEWTWRFLGFGVGRTPRFTDMHGREFSFWIVPYWSIVTPFSLLSAWLLLSKPRKSTWMKTTEPAAVEGA